MAKSTSSSFSSSSSSSTVSSFSSTSSFSPVLADRDHGHSHQLEDRGRQEMALWGIQVDFAEVLLYLVFSLASSLSSSLDCFSMVSTWPGHQGLGAERERRGLRLNPGHRHGPTFPTWPTCCHRHCRNHLCSQVPCTCQIVQLYNFWLFPSRVASESFTDGSQSRTTEALT